MTETVTIGGDARECSCLIRNTEAIPGGTRYPEANIISRTSSSFEHQQESKVQRQFLVLSHE